MRKITITLIIWTICFAAITASAVLVHKWLHNRGPVITITFEDATGLIPGQSKIIYRGASMGLIKKISIDPDTNRVLVTARMNATEKELLGANSKFWLVEPEIELDEISNLNAIATGNYIEMLPSKGELTTKFVALDKAPINPAVTSGLKIILSSCNIKGISLDSPILYRGFQVGEIGTIGLSKDRRYALVTAYIFNEYRDVVRTSSYFANISGFHANLHVFGTSEISMNSLHTLVAGGIILKTPDLTAPRAKDGATFKILTAEKLEELEA